MRVSTGTLAAVILAAGVLFFFARTSRAQSLANSVAPGHPVATLRLTWHDAARDRDVPVLIYYPADTRKPCPMIIFSHGLGGSRNAYGYLGHGWARAGYISVHVQHLGSDDALWRGNILGAFAQLSAAVKNPANAVNRAKDIPYAIDQMLALDHDSRSPLHGLVNDKEIGVAGHSFGAWTALTLVGQSNGPGVRYADPRIKSAIAMSAPVPGGAAASSGKFAGIKLPVFHMTGTRDDSPIGETAAADRRIPYDQSTTPGTCLLILSGADHMTFSGHIVGGFLKDDTRYQALILSASIAFWNATLRNDTASHQWLYQGGFKALLGQQGTFEFR